MIRGHHCAVPLGSSVAAPGRVFVVSLGDAPRKTHFALKLFFYLPQHQRHPTVSRVSFQWEWPADLCAEAAVPSEPLGAPLQKGLPLPRVGPSLPRLTAPWLSHPPSPIAPLLPLCGPWDLRTTQLSLLGYNRCIFWQMELCCLATTCVDTSAAHRRTS